MSRNWGKPRHFKNESFGLEDFVDSKMQQSSDSQR